MRKRRKMPEMNAGSMADIAFLLLIFFLVVTTIAEDKGIPVILPEYYDGPAGEAPERDVLTILVNGEDNVLIESKPTPKDEVKKIVVDFVTNPTGDNNKPVISENAIISIQNDINTSYEVYVKIYSQIHEAYSFMRNTMAQAKFQTEYAQLSIPQKNTILQKFPLKVSEADPFKLPNN